MTREQIMGIVGDDVARTAFGYADLEKQDALLGAIAVLPTADRLAAMRALTAPKAAIPSGLQATGRDETLRRLDALPQNIKNGLTSKALQLVDSIWYVVKDANGAQSLRMLTNQDTKDPGVGNVAFQKMEKDFFFLPHGIQVLTGVNDDPLLAGYGLSDDLLLNGEFEFKANGKYMMPKDTSCRIFDTQSKTDTLVGFHRLHNPKWIEPQVDIIFDIRFSAPMTADTNVALYLHGTTVIPY